MKPSPKPPLTTTTSRSKAAFDLTANTHGQRPNSPLGRTCIALIVLIYACRLLGAPATADEPSPPVSPRASLELFDLAPGLSIELVAAEPQVIDPIAIRFDPAGRMWVVEMRDYPRGPSPGSTPQSRISILTDEDHDGYFEGSQVFANELLFPTGLQLWNDGAFVTLAGRVMYLKDTTGDGQADFQEVWYTGFAEQNPQLRANHPYLAADNYIYVANGLRGGEIVDARSPQKSPVSIRTRDFRFDPLTREFEAISGTAQFGLTFDDAGNRFICSNRNPAMHVVLESRHLARNPAFQVPRVVHDVAKAGAESRVFPITRAWTTSNLHAGQFTAACGVTCYRGSALPANHYGNLFTCEPTGHLIHREIVAPQGATFTATPGTNKSEFLASRDEWCRPVNLHVGPDGALYVIDMYRAVIEHPDWAPEELKDRPDELYGTQHGRIYRISSQNAPLRSDHDATFTDTSPRTLIHALSHPNVWQRETAARLLLESQDRSSASALKALVNSDALSTARGHAIQLLAGLDALDPQTLRLALSEPNPTLLRHALAASESIPEPPDEIRDAIRRLVNHQNAQIRVAAMLAMAPFEFSPEPPVDEWEATAIAIAAGNRPGTLLQRFLQHNGGAVVNQPPTAWLLQELSELIGQSIDANEQAKGIVTITNIDGEIGIQCLHRFLSAAVSRHGNLDTWKQTVSASLGSRLEKRLAQAARIATNASSASRHRQIAIPLMAYHTDGVEILTSLATSSSYNEIQAAAAHTLATVADTEHWSRVLQEFKFLTPMVRRKILDGSMVKEERIRDLFGAIEAGDVRATEVDPHHIRHLCNHRSDSIRQQAEKIFDTGSSDREAVLRDYQTIFSLRSNPQHGREVFRENCAMCHRIGNVGVDVAPDISDSRTKTAEQYLKDIIQPNRSIDANYVSYTAITKDGRVLTGVLATETATGLTLLQPEGKSSRLRSDELEELISNGVSLMPDGLEKQINKQQMADLISFIKNWRYLDGLTPLRKPLLDSSRGK